MSARSALVPLLLAAVLAPAFAHAAKPNLDALATGAPGAAARARIERLRTDPALRALGAVTGTDARLGVPTFVSVPAVAPAATRLPLAAAARAHVARLAPLYGLTAADVSAAPLDDLHDTGDGPVIARFGQVIDGVRVFRDRLTLLMTRDGALLASTGYIPGRGLGARGTARAFRIGAPAAIAAALRDDGIDVEAGALRRGAALPGGYDAYAAPGAGLEPVRITRVWFHEPEALQAAYYLELIGETAAYGYVISAADGAILYRNDLVANDVFAYRVWADAAGIKQPWDGPQGTAPTPHPTATATLYDPPLLAPNLVSLQNGPISTNDPWLAPGATQTSGNNIDAYADLNAPDGFSGGDFRATTSSANTFDRTFDVTQDPAASATQRQASITQLFYTTNYLHDWFYDDGFNEASGNAQASNYGRGGVQGDVLHAEAQDYFGTNNANMMTPADGGSPRMQMYVFTPSSARLTVQSPPAIAGDYSVGVAAFGPQTFDVTAQVVLVADAVAPTSDGCETPYANAAQLTGKIAIIDRGTCGFTVKVKNAQTQGAIAVIIVNNVAGTAPGLGGTDGTITIPSLSLSQADGNAIKAQLGGGPVTVRLLRGALHRDGSLDMQIVAHEWGHYISNRLVGNSTGLSNQQGNAMGEGWGDFHAMLLTVRAEDAGAAANANWSGTYGLGAYALSTQGVPTTVYYFGLRRVPYSTDLSKDGLTFKHIQHGVALPAVPTAFGQDGSQNEEVHNTGEVWCTMLWECYAALLNDTGRLTFAQAQARMKQYLVAAYKITPVAPTITEARDALLAVAYASDPADHALFCSAFAKRGCGVGAVSPDRWSTDFAGVVESFTCGGDLAFGSASLTDEPTSCDHDGYLDVNETGRLDLVLHNTGSTSLSATTVTVSSANPAISFPGGTTVPVPASSPFGTTSVSVPVHMASASGIQAYDVQVSWNDPGFVTAVGHSVTVHAYGNTDAVPSVTETVEEHAPLWTYSGSPYAAAYAWHRKEITQTSHRFAAPDVGTLSDEYLVSPPLVVGASPFVITFSTRYSFESDGSPTYYDGGVIELSTNGGGSWTDVGASASPGYGGTIFNGAGNVLSNRPAWVGANASWPGFDTETVSFGTTYAGQTVLVRFRLGTDEAAGGEDWEIDDVQVTGVSPAPFTTLAGNATTCLLAVGDGDGDAAPAQLAFALAGAHPIAGAARFELALPRAGHARVDVFDLSGRRAATLADGEFAAGRHTVTWPASASRAPGVYFARLAFEGRELERRIVVVR